MVFQNWTLFCDRLQSLHTDTKSHLINECCIKNTLHYIIHLEGIMQALFMNTIFTETLDNYIPLDCRGGLWRRVLALESWLIALDYLRYSLSLDSNDYMILNNATCFHHMIWQSEIPSPRVTRNSITSTTDSLIQYGFHAYQRNTFWVSWSSSRGTLELGEGMQFGHHSSMSVGFAYSDKVRISKYMSTAEAFLVLTNTTACKYESIICFLS